MYHEVMDCSGCFLGKLASIWSEICGQQVSGENSTCEGAHGCDAVTAAIHLSISPEGAGAGRSSHRSCIEAGADLCVSARDDLRETVSWVLQQSFISFINLALKGVLLCPESRPKSHPVFSSIKSSLLGIWLHTDHRFYPHRAWLTQVVSAGPDSLRSPGTCVPAARWGGQVIACPAE